MAKSFIPVPKFYCRYRHFKRQYSSIIDYFMAEFIGATRCCAADADMGGCFNISEWIPSLRNIVPEGWISWANDG